MTDSQQKLRQAIKVIPMEREKLLVSYISMLAIDMDQAKFLKRYLVDFAQLLTDYSALGQFELIDSILSTETGNSANSGKTQHLLVKLQQTTDQYLIFIERYQTPESTHNLQELCEDLEKLGVSLAERFEIEDKLIQNSATAN